MGEGAGILVLETEEHALARGAKIYCELAGYGSSGDAEHVTTAREDGKGAAQAMLAALEDAEVEGSEVGRALFQQKSSPFLELRNTKYINRNVNERYGV